MIDPVMVQKRVGKSRRTVEFQKEGAVDHLQRGHNLQPFRPALTGRRVYLWTT